MPPACKGDGIWPDWCKEQGLSSCRLHAKETVSGLTGVRSRDCNWDEAREGGRYEGSNVDDWDRGSDVDDVAVELEFEWGTDVDNWEGGTDVDDNWEEGTDLDDWEGGTDKSV